MNLLVVEFASKNIKDVLSTICFLLGKMQREIQVLAKENVEEFSFESWEGSLEAAFSELESGKLSAIQISTNDEQLQLATIYSPRFVDGGIDEYSCISEFKGTLSLAESKINDISTTITGLTYLSLSLEEPLDINENISIDSNMFPWDDWRLILASCIDRELKTGAGYDRLLSQSAE